MGKRISRYVYSKSVVSSQGLTIIAGRLGAVTVTRVWPFGLGTRQSRGWGSIVYVVGLGLDTAPGRDMSACGHRRGRSQEGGSHGSRSEEGASRGRAPLLLSGGFWGGLYIFWRAAQPQK